MKEEKKYCSSCNKIKTLKEFRKLWCGLRSSICRECNIKDGFNGKDD